MERKEEETRLQKLARLCQHGVIGSLEKFFEWYGSLIATYPKYAIVISIAATVIGGLGLIRYFLDVFWKMFLISSFIFQIL